jgi:hypothetical protein
MTRRLLLALVVLVSLIGRVDPALAGQGKIVANFDEWTLSDTAFQNPLADTATFASNVAAWFSGGGSGSFLVYSTNTNLFGNLTRNHLVSAGHSVNTGTPLPFTLTLLQQYDGVFIALPVPASVNVAVLVQYVKAGGNVYLAGGTGIGGAAVEADRWNPFLNAFGLHFGTPYVGPSRVRQFSSTHPVFAGATRLYSFFGNPVSRLNLSDPNTELATGAAIDGSDGPTGLGTIGFFSVPTPSDTTPPQIVATPSGSLGNNGWYVSNVTVNWSVTDAESQITSSSGCGSITVSTDTAGMLLTCTATSAGGTASSSITIKRDATPPTISSTKVPAANAYGWNNVNVSVSFTCQDGMSLVATCGPNATVTSEGAGQSVTGNATDQAGNAASAVVGGINIDKTAPTITPSKSPAPNALGWNTTDVTVAFTCQDTLSGLAGPCPTPQTVTTEGTGQTRSATVTDRAGNSATATAGGINIDKTPPTVVCSATPSMLWPPNHQLVAIEAQVAIPQDNGSGSGSVSLQSVVSNEPDNGLGDGDTANDIQGFVLNTPNAGTRGSLRAERSSGGSGRIYTLTYLGGDRAGNVAPCTVAVSVPKSKGK